MVDQQEEMTHGGPALRVQGLCVDFPVGDSYARAVSDSSFELQPGEIVGLVGESGSGKTVTGLSIMGLLPSAETSGSVKIAGKEVQGLSPKEWAPIRGREIAMVFQDSLTALDPVFTIGSQLVETIRAHTKLSKSEARDRSIRLLADVGIPEPEARFKDYPHQLSGGMRQRVMIAVALADNPSVVIADEPTTALDVTLQAQILDLLRRLSREYNSAMLFITHDLGVVAELCSRVITMYAGEIVEVADVDDTLTTPKHPYTSGLIGAIPRADQANERMTSIPGRVPGLDEMPEGCRFAPRCEFAQDVCIAEHPQLEAFEGRLARCHFARELDLPGAVTAVDHGERDKECAKA